MTDCQENLIAHRICILKQDITVNVFFQLILCRITLHRCTFVTELIRSLLLGLWNGCDVLPYLFSVCLPVYLSSRISQKPYVQTLLNVVYMLPVDVARSFTDNSAVCFVLPVWDDVMLSHNGANRHTGSWRIFHLDSPGGANCLVYVSGCGFMLYRGIAFVRNIC